MTQKLLNEGYLVQPVSPDTDFVIINTCTVTNEADRKSRQQIRRAKKIAPNSTTIAMGCSVQVMNTDGEKIADYHFGNGEKNRSRATFSNVRQSLLAQTRSAHVYFNEPGFKNQTKHHDSGRMHQYVYLL